MRFRSALNKNELQTPVADLLHNGNRFYKWMNESHHKSGWLVLIQVKYKMRLDTTGDFNTTCS